MGLESIWHWAILLLIVVLLFGTKKLTGSGKDLGKAVREFKDAMHGDDKDKDTSSTGAPESLKADSTFAEESAQQKQSENSEQKEAS